MASLIIDPGHGGSDPGANGHGIREKDWALRISLYQYRRLKELGAKVGITRTTDRTLDSVQRTNLIRNKYDYCMSNHWNAFNGKARGVETIHSVYSNQALAKRLADAVLKASGLPFRRVFSRKNSSGGDYYFMHRLTGNTKTVIVEYGFIDNKADNNFYKNDANFYAVAEAVIKEWCAILGVKYVAPRKDGDLTVSQYNELKKLINGQAKKITSLERELKRKQNVPSNSQTPNPSHVASWKRAEREGWLNGKNPHHDITREQFATVLSRVLDEKK